MKTRSLILAAAILATASLVGCSGHGASTAQHQSNAKLKMDAIKAATQWQTAHQAFLAGDLNKALKHVNIALELNPSVTKSHVLRGRVLMEQGELEEAGLAFNNAATIDPSAVDPQYFLGVLHERFAQKDKALAFYMKAVELDPENPQYAIAAAEMMMDLDRMPEAKDFLTQRLNTFEHNAGVRQTLGHIAMIEKDYVKAADFFEIARMLSPDDYGIQEDLARAQVQTQDYAAAETTIARLMSNEAFKERRDLKLLQATCLIKTDRPVQARDILFTLTNDHVGSADAEAWIALGNACYLVNDLSNLRSAANRVVALAPRRAEGYLLRGLHARETKDFPNAERAVRQALAIDQTADAFMLLGMIYQDSGKDRLAQASFEKAQQIAGSDSSTTNGTITNASDAADVPTE